MRNVGLSVIISILFLCFAGSQSGFATLELACDHINGTGDGGELPFCKKYAQQMHPQESGGLGQQGEPGGENGTITTPRYPTLGDIYTPAFWNTNHTFSTTSPDWNWDIDPINPAPIVGTIVNPKLSACLNGWNGPGGKKMDCVEPPSNLVGFDALYNMADPTGTNFVEGIPLPNRLYLTNANGDAVSGFYREDGHRCSPTVGGEPTRDALFTQMENALAATNSETFLQGLHYDTRCVFVIRTALRVQCPVQFAGPLSVVPNQGYSPTLRRRCAVAEKINVEFDIQDISKSGARGRGNLRAYSSMPNNPAGIMQKNAVSIAPIDYRSVLLRKRTAGSPCPQYTPPGATEAETAPGLQVAGELCQIASP